MPKLLVERPRGGWRASHDRCSLRGVRDLDALPKQVSIARDNPRTKWLNENLAPLARLLERRVGLAWDRVYSEIRAQIRCEDPIQQHVLQHLWQFVELHVVMIEGVPHDALGRPIARGRWRSRFYVCPSTGLLRRTPPAARRQRRDPDQPPPERKRKRNGSRR
ncbi:hypothetical protein ACNOYE_30275 [Nannocystaceae bacterium ST9]